MTPHPGHRAVASTIACAAAWVLSCPTPVAGANITPATFEEIVNIGSFTRQGADLAIAESVSLTVPSSEFAERGGGSGNAWTVPVNPVSTGIDLDLTGGTNPSGIGGTAFTQTRYQYTVVKLDPLLPDVVDLTFSGFASVSVVNNQPQGIPTWFSYGLIWVDSRQFAVRNSDANGIYTGLFEDEWHQVPLGSFAVGAIGTIQLDAFSHGEGSGPDFRFHSQVLIDPTIEVSSPNAQGYRVEFSPGIAVPPAATVPEPASLALLTMGLAGVVARTFSKSLTRRALLVAIAVFCGGAAPAVGQVLDIKLWPDGVVHYRYCSDDPNCDATLDLTGRELPNPSMEKGNLRAMMTNWEDALNLPSPLNGRRHKYVQFVRCINDCPDSHVLVRYTNADENGNMCSYDRTSATGEKLGQNPSGQTVLHFERPQPSATPPIRPQPMRIMLHELGHCLGLWHEFNRRDADRWLREDPELDGADFEDAFGTRFGLIPVLGNYDYDSIMHYASFTEGPLFSDYFRNALDKSAQGAVVSAKDRSRVLQYYANERYTGWGFFTPIRHEPQDPDALPYPYLAAGGIEAVGTPAIAYQSPGNYDIFARGSDGHIYWKIFRQVGNLPVTAGWRSIACCFRSDPSAVSRGVDRIDVVAVSDGGDLRRIKYIDGAWSAPLTIRGGHPAAGIKTTFDGDYLGAAISSRGADLLDVFVVDDDGRLAVTTWSAGNWGQWHTLGIDHVTARPAAVALSATEVRLAINRNEWYLYEPLVTFSSLPSSDLGDATASMAYRTAPTLATRNGQIDRYRVLIVNAQGRISHRVASGSWRDIGGIPKLGTGIAAVATSDFGFVALMNGEDATGCLLSCSTDLARAPRPGGQLIQAGGLWIRHFN